MEQRQYNAFLIRLFIVCILLLTIKVQEVFAQKCISGDCKNGQGTFTWPDGDRYTGDFVNGTRTGTGILLWHTGEKYDGDWVNGQMEGNGILMTARGEKYIGSFTNGETTQNGSWYYPDGSLDYTRGAGAKKKKGCISGNCRNGTGTFVNEKGEKYSGDFVDGKYNGTGKFYGLSELYNGHWLNNKKNGTGTIIYPWGRKYTGEFKDNQTTENGTYFLKNGQIDKTQGLGAKKYPDSIYIQHAQKLLNLLETGQFDVAASRILHQKISNGNLDSPAILKKIWLKIHSECGRITGFGPPVLTQSQAEFIVSIPCQFSDFSANAIMKLDTGLQIFSLSINPYIDNNLYIMPDYGFPANTLEKQITVFTDSFKLPGMFLYPKAREPKKYPVVILVHGSGSWDMDEGFMANEPFKDLAYGLVAHGISVLRYTKRNYRYVGDPASLEEETIKDAISAIKLAKSFNEVDTGKIYILGHSLGAMAAPRIAKEYSGFLAGIILMAAPAKPLEDVFLDQRKYLLQVDTTNSALKLKGIADFKKTITLIRSNDLKPETPKNLLPMDVPGSYWIDLNHYHQVKVAASLKTPILVLQGENDFQVYFANYEIWKRSLKHHKNAKFISYPGLNHPFMKFNGKSTGDEYFIPSHIDPQVINDIASWVSEQ